jgi:amino acid adenylation domain-containing protein
MSDLYQRIRTLSPKQIALLAKRLERRDPSSVTTIARQDGEKPGQLSFAQQRLWFLHQLAPEDPSYNIALAVRLSGELDIWSLNEALNEILRRHEVLRTTFVVVDGQPLLSVSLVTSFPLPFIDLAVDGSEQRARELAQEEAQLPFDLARGPLVRGKLLRLATDVYVLLVTMHHIISDEWSIRILFNELSALYNGYVADAPARLAEPTLQYADYAVWQNEKLNGLLNQELSYWKKQLAELPAVLELPTDRPRPAIQNYRGAKTYFVLPESLTMRLKRLTAEEGVTLFMTLLAAFQTLLSRYTGQQDIVVGAPVAGRNRAETERLIGFFVNTLVLRSEVNGAWSFREFLKHVRDVCLGAYANQDIPFERLVEELQPERSMSHQPLFQVMFQLHTASRDLPALTGLEWDWFARETGEAVKFDLMLSLDESEHELGGTFAFNTDLFEKPTIERMGRHFVRLLESIVAAPDQQLAKLSLLSEAERTQLLVDRNKTATDYPRRCVHELFEEQVARAAENVALICGTQQLSYRELNERANQVAHYLRGLGVGPEVPVGIAMERSVELMVGLLGILKAGGAYVPIDAQLPAERISFMIEDAQVELVLSEAHLGKAAGLSSENPCVAVAAEALAYVMYTSGSTGVPKGVSVPHRAVVRLVKNTNYVEFGERETLLQLAPISFDASTFEIWGSLLNGGRLVLMPPQPPSLVELGEALKRHQVTTLWLTAGLFHLMVDERLEDLSGVRQLLAGGDVLSVEHVEWYLAVAGEAVLINGYGPTENTTFSCTYRMNAGWRGGGTSVPIGRPIANTQVYVLDEGLEPVPLGVAGELYLGGEGLARDYLHQPQLTAAKFVPHPYSGVAGARLYGTGDQVRWLADGNLEFLGRIDQQVKIRGFRVELGEIEAVLKEGEHVREAVVVARGEEAGEKRLVAYVVGAKVHSSELREYLKGRLPEYMVPAVFVELAELPLTANGKVERRALPPPSVRDLELDEEYAVARTAAEEILSGIWREVLGVERVGIDDNFFALGGHSLKATQVMSRVRQACAVELPLRSLFAWPTVRELGREVERQWAAGTSSTEVALVRVEGRGGELPLSFAQQRLWFLEQLEPESGYYNVPAAIRLAGPLNVAALERSVNEIVSRHEVLRSRFLLRAGEPRQVIEQSAAISLAVQELERVAVGERESEARALLQREARAPFDLAQGPMLRVRVLRVAAEEHLVLLSLPHIVADGWSMEVLIRELETLYEAFSGGAATSPLPQLALQYADYAGWQREWLQGERLEQQLSYWRKQLAGAASLELPTDYVRPAVRSAAGRVQRFSIEPEVSERLKVLSQQRGVTMFMTMLAAWQLLLARYSRQTEIVVGTPIAGRTRRETESLIGCFVNTVVLRTDCAGDPSFVELLERVREVCLGAYAHQEVPFEKLVEELEPQRDLSRSPLFQVLFALPNTPRKVLRLSGLQVSAVALEAETTKFDLALTLSETEQGLKGSLEYRTDLYRAETIERMAEQLRRMLAAVAAEPERRVSQLELLSEAERQQLLVEWNETGREYEREKSLAELFEAQVERRAAATALVFAEARLSYGELNERANQLAHYLRRLGVGPEVLVGLMVERSLELGVGVLGIMKAGGVYVPLEPSYPAERIGQTLADGPVAVLLTQQRLFARLPALRMPVLCLDSDWPLIAQESVANPERETSQGNLAYVIYTSGSTGQPKGVMIEQRSVPNLLAGLSQAIYRSAAPLRIALNAPLVFDASLQQLVQLCAGHTLYLVPEAVRADGAALTSFLQAQEIEAFDCTPAHLRVLLECGLERNQSLQLVLVGGEAIDDPLWTRLADSRTISYYNLYGPTECTVDPLTCRISKETAATIGKPMANVQAYVLDEQLTPVGIGMVGELFLGGAGLGRGYLQRPALTAERFIPHPFSQEKGARLYRTGDLVKYLPDGSLAFIGRRDQQIKLRGHRIELGEIEAVLKEGEHVREAVVVARGEEAGEKRLVAYVVGAKVNSSELREYLKGRLPEYMVPAVFVELAELPLTANGKVERRALPPPSVRDLELDEEYAVARTAAEEILSGIWREVLGVERVGIDDNFFALGGHSLKATQVMSRVRQACAVELPLRSLFAWPTVRELGREVERQWAAGTSSTEVALVRVEGRGGELPLSFAQQRLWFLEQLEPESGYYNVPAAIRLAGPLNVAALERSVNEIVSRHEVLRSRFLLRAGEPRQVIEQSAAISLAVQELERVAVGERESEARALLQREARAPFDLAQGPMLRVRVLRVAAEEHLVLLSLPHIVADGWSMEVLIRELETLYEAFSGGAATSPLPQLALQYADYAGWQREWLQGERLEQQLSYWRKQLAGAASLELPTDYVRPAVRSAAGRVQRFSIEPEVSERLKVLSQQRGVTMFMTMLAAWQLLLARYSRQTEIVVGTPIAGRTRRETESLIGCFVNTVVLRTDCAGDPSFVELLERVREVCLGAYAHQEVPFEKLVEELEPQRDLSRSPLFQVLFALPNTPRKVLRLSGLQVSAVALEAETTKFDLALTLSETEQGLKGSLEYRTDLYRAETIERMAEQLRRMLAAVAAEPERRVSQLELLSEAERQQLLVEWNETGREYEREKSLAELFEAQVERRAAATALVFAEARLSYGELNERANQLAHYLRRLGVGPEVLVGLMVERSLELGVGVLGIMKAGGVYVPLEPSYPAERIGQTLADGPVAVLLTQQRLFARLPALRMPVLCLDSDWPLIAQESVANPERETSQGNLAYVIYTSGSTGQPKGVMIEQRSVPNLLAGLSQAIYRSAAPLRIALNAPLVFDASLQQLVQLCAGHTLYLVPEAVRADGAALTSFLQAQEIEAFDCTPAHLRVLLECGLERNQSLQLVLVGGEAIDDPLWTRLADSRTISYYNLYGPTECTVDPLTCRISKETAATIGKPMANVQAYVLDEQLTPVGIGMVGELFLGGAGLGRGYLQRPALTAERFIPHPFSQEKGARLYRTGDLVKYLPDGSLAFIGRRDQQIKLRGHRIELGEIEAVLKEGEHVREAVVVARGEEAGEKRLVAYVVGAKVNSSELREYLKGRLPEYMVPAAIIELEQLPLTPNGKLDRSKLPPPNFDSQVETFVAPQTPTEQSLAQIWSEVLLVERLSIHDNFFDLGGHSLLATQMFSRIEDVFEIELPLRALFETPTVAGLAELIERELTREYVYEAATQVSR